MARKKREDGRIQITATVGLDENGKRIRKSFYGKTLTEARLRRDVWQEEQQRKEKFADPDITLEEWSSLWLKSVEGTTEPSTHRNKVYAVKMLNQFEYDGTAIGNLRVVDLMPIQIQTYMKSLSGMSKGTISQRRCVLKAILRSAVANGVINRDPWINIKSPKGTYNGHRALNPSEQKLVLGSIGAHRCGIWAATMMLTGIHREELAALNVEDIDLANRQIRIRAAIAMADGGRRKETKTAAGERTIPIFDQLYEPLKNCIGDRKNGLLFTAVSGNSLPATSFQQAWRSYMIAMECRINSIEPCGETAGYRMNAAVKQFANVGKTYRTITEFTPHDLRYTYATILYDAGVDVKTAAYLLGHADIGVTMRIYTKLSEKKKLEGLDSLNEYMKREYLS